MTTHPAGGGGLAFRLTWRFGVVLVAISGLLTVGSILPAMIDARDADLTPDDVWAVVFLFLLPAAVLALSAWLHRKDHGIAAQVLVAVVDLGLLLFLSFAAVLILLFARHPFHA